MAAETPDYKTTINLPKTDFPMRGNLPENEPKYIQAWEKNDIYQKMVDKNKSKEKFVMPDGPPYANGNIHIGHALNKILKDIVIKYKNMNGHSAAFIPGWDCHGLPIEINIQKKLSKEKIKRSDLSDREFRDRCREFAKGFVNLQRDQFIRLGILADWQNPYLTLQPEYEANEIRVLAKILENGHLYRGEKPVNWCPKLQTALAAAEVEYMDHKSPSIYVKFYVKDELEKLGNPDKPTAFVIWTTTPWTIPSNYGICLNAKFEYSLYDTGSEYLIIAKELKEAFESETELKLTEVRTYTGDHFENMNAEHPFLDRKSKLILGDHVTIESGTGCVHTAPAHGMDDYIVGLKYGLPVKSMVNKAGKFTSDLPEFEGVRIWDANDLLCEKMQKSGHLIIRKDIVHSYPHNPRTKTPLIQRSTPQWFIRMDSIDDSKTGVRQKALQLIENDINFVPAWGRARLTAMVQNSPDWCVSRQRTWGVPIPVFICSECEEPLADAAIMNKIADKMSSTGEGLEAFFSTDISEFVGDRACSCGSRSFQRGKDILDVWFDSGVCHTAVQMQKPELAFPADIYLEGSDQHRGWFQTSLISSVAAYNEPPYKALITHGFVNDAEGKKMSKSQGNVIDPKVVSEKYGAEILRLWVAYEDYGQDVKISQEMFKRISETYRRIRNTMRFLLGNLCDFDVKKDSIDFDKLDRLDQWALIKLNRLIENTTKAYDEYNFYKVYHALNHFFTVELSATYLDILKDRLYTGKKDGFKRRSSQTVIHHLLENLVSLMAPILTFISEETYKYLPADHKESVLLTDFPKVNPKWQAQGLEDKFEALLDVRSQSSKILEELRSAKTIGSSLDAKLIVSAEGKTLDVLKEFELDLCEYLIVSQVDLKQGPENIEAVKAEGEKCVRCWNFSTKIDEDNNLPGICPKCVEALT